MYAEPVVL